MIRRTGFVAAFCAVASLGGSSACAESGGPAKREAARISVERLNDKAIAVEVKSALQADPSTSGLVFQIETDKGIVRLSGLVRSEAEKRRAVEIARGVEGVMDVKSDIWVGR